MAERYENYIDGKWTPPSSGKYFPSYNPATGEIVGEFAASSAADVDAAAKSAAAAFESWTRKVPFDRVGVIYKFMELLDRDKDAIAGILSREQGKPLTEAIGEPVRGIRECRFMVGEATRMSCTSVPSDRPGVAIHLQRASLGVVAAISPWNFPFLTPIRKIVPALIYGCTVIFKPASDTPLVGVTLMKLLEEAGVPAGVVNLVTGSGGVIGDAIAGHKLISGISFTGSTGVGRRINEKAAASFKKVQLEMGGKNPVIVSKYSDIPFAADQIVANAFSNAGQRCTTISRVLVVESMADAIEKALAERIAALKVGNGMTQGTQIGPMINAAAGEEVMAAVEETLQAGAKAMVGGKRMTGGEFDKGFFIQPTLLTGVTHAMRIAGEEVFGPVLSVIRVKDFAEAMRLANDTAYGLTSAIFTEDAAEEFEFMRDIEAGMGHINHGTSSEGHLPFGGVKESGLGIYSIGDTNKDFYTNLKIIYKMFTH